MHELDRIKEMFINQGKDGCFGIWEVVKVVKADLAINNPEDIRSACLSVASALIDAGMRAGESPYVTAGTFIPWEDGPEASKDRIRRDSSNRMLAERLTDGPWFGFIS